MRTLIFLLLFSCFARAQVVIDWYKFESDAIGSLSPLFYYTPASIDTDAVTDGTSLSGTGAAVWADTSGNGFHCTIGGGTFVLNVGSTGRQVEWTSSAWLDIPSNASLNLVPGTNEFTIVYRIGDGVNPTGSGYTLSKAPSATGQRTGSFFGTASNYSSFTVGGTANTPSPTTVAANSLVIFRVSTSSVDVWIDGTQVVTGGTVGTGDPGTQSWNIGGRTDGSYLAASGFMMDLVALIPSAITSGQRAAIETQYKVN